MGVIMKNSVEYGVNGGVTDVMLNNSSIVGGGIASIPLVSSSTDGAVPAGATVSTQDQTTKFLREDGSWAVPSYTSKTDKANVDGSNITNAATFRGNIGFGGANGINSWVNVEPSKISVETSTLTDVYNYTLTPGIYMIHYIGNWDKNSSGLRIIIMDSNSGVSINGGRNTADTLFVNTHGNSYDAFHEHIRVVGVSSNTIYYFKAYQNSGSTLGFYPVINIIKLQ